MKPVSFQLYSLPKSGDFVSFIFFCRVTFFVSKGHAKFTERNLTQKLAKPKFHSPPPPPPISCCNNITVCCLKKWSAQKCANSFLLCFKISAVFKLLYVLILLQSAGRMLIQIYFLNHIMMYSICVILCLFSTLSHRVGTSQISIIIIVQF